jgi:hypothetical protein
MTSSWPPDSHTGGPGSGKSPASGDVVLLDAVDEEQALGVAQANYNLGLFEDVPGQLEPWQRSPECPACLRVHARERHAPPARRAGGRRAHPGLRAATAAIWPPASPSPAGRSTPGSPGVSGGRQRPRTSTILPVTPPVPSNSCACLASARGSRCAISGLIFCCRSRSNRAIKSCRNSAGFSRSSHWML